MLNHFRLKLLVAAVGMAVVPVATAATNQSLHAQNLGAVPVNALAAQLNLGPDMSLAPGSSVGLANSLRVVRQQQLFRGVPVYGRSIAVVQDAQGNALRATGELLQNAQFDLTSVTPKLSAAAALSALKGHAQTMLAGGATIENEQADLFVYPQDSGATRLVYRVS